MEDVLFGFQIAFYIGLVATLVIGLWLMGRYFGRRRHARETPRENPVSDASPRQTKTKQENDWRGLVRLGLLVLELGLVVATLFYYKINVLQLMENDPVPTIIVIIGGLILLVGLNHHIVDTGAKAAKRVATLVLAAFVVGLIMLPFTGIEGFSKFFNYLRHKTTSTIDTLTKEKEGPRDVGLIMFPDDGTEIKRRFEANIPRIVAIPPNHCVSWWVGNANIKVLQSKKESITLVTNVTEDVVLTKHHGLTEQCRTSALQQKKNANAAGGP